MEWLSQDKETVFHLLQPRIRNTQANMKVEDKFYLNCQATQAGLEETLIILIHQLVAAGMVAAELVQAIKNQALNSIRTFCHTFTLSASHLCTTSWKELVANLGTTESLTSSTDGNPMPLFSIQFLRQLSWLCLLFWLICLEFLNCLETCSSLLLCQQI